MLKRRLLILGFLLAVTFLATVVFSDAPLRVHAAHLLTWYPPIFGAAAIIWSRCSSALQKVLGIFLLFSFAGWLALYASTVTVKKMEMSLLYYGAGILGWLLALPIFLVLVLVVEKLLPPDHTGRSDRDFSR